MSGRIPPNSEEAEKGALGALLQDGLRLIPIARRLGVGPAAFYVPANRVVMEGILAVADGGVQADQITVWDWIQREEGGAGVPATYLDSLVDGCPASAHGEYYLDIVRNKAIARGVIEAARAVEAEAYQAESGEEIAKRAADSFVALVTRGPEEQSNRQVCEVSLQKWQDAVDGKKPATGLEVPWGALNRLMCGLEVGVTIIAGRPSMGKTTIEDCIATYLASQGVGVARATLDSTAEELLERAMCRKAGVSLPRVKRGYVGQSHIDKLREAADCLGDYPMWINDRDREIRAICSWARMMKAKNDIGLFTVDFVQLIQVPEISRPDKVAQVSLASERLKALSFELRIPVLVLAQLNRAVEKEDREPQLSDLRDSGALEQDASKVIFSYRDEKQAKRMEDDDPQQGTRKRRPMWLDLLKHKGGETGRIPFWMLAPYFRFVETTDAWEYDATEKIDDDDEFREYEKKARAAGESQGILPRAMEVLPPAEEDPPLEDPPMPEEGNFDDQLA